MFQIMPAYDITLEAGIFLNSLSAIHISLSVLGNVTLMQIMELATSKHLSLMTGILFPNMGSWDDNLSVEIWQNCFLCEMWVAVASFFVVILSNWVRKTCLKGAFRALRGPLLCQELLKHIMNVVLSILSSCFIFIF
jgi:hypothetical protein